MNIRDLTSAPTKRAVSSPVEEKPFFDFDDEDGVKSEDIPSEASKKQRVPSTVLERITPSNLHSRTQTRTNKSKIGVTNKPLKPNVPKYDTVKEKEKKPRGVAGAEGLSPEDRQYIDENAGAIPVDDIADHLGKKRSTVFRYMEQHDLLSQEDIRDARVKRRIINNLHNEAFWYVIEEGYTEKERAYFEETWYQYMVQLDINVTPTELENIKSLIETNIRINRMTINEQKINDDIARLDVEIQNVQNRMRGADEDEMEELTHEIQALMNSQSALAASRTSIAKEISTCQKDQSQLMKDLDVTRARRVEKSDMSDKTWTRMLTEIKENPLRKRQMGAVAFLSMMATERARARLMQPYTYADGEVGHPMLLPEDCINHDLVALAEQYVPCVE